jgi:cytochrome c peroxidase
MAADVAAKPGIEREHQSLLDERYDLGDHPAQGVTMEHGKPLQEGVRVKLFSGVTWEQLAAMSPDAIREQGLWPKGFLPLPHPFHPTGGFVFPQNAIDAIKLQDGRDLTRFDVDFDLPERFLAAFPPEMYLTSGPDLGDVSQGKLVTLTNFFELFNGIISPRELEGLRLLVTPFRSSSSTRPTIASRQWPAKARPVSTVTRMAIRTVQRTLIPVSARSGTATDLRPCRSAG